MPSSGPIKLLKGEEVGGGGGPECMQRAAELRQKGKCVYLGGLRGALMRSVPHLSGLQMKP